jgi:uncharacterized protein (TIGR03435 family)
MRDTRSGNAGLRIVAAFALLLPWFTIACHAQGQKALGDEPAFEVVSFKDAGTSLDHMAGDPNSRMRRLEFKGNRLRGEDGLFSLMEFAFSPLIGPLREDSIEPINSIRGKWYSIEAIAPVGTTLDGARAMLRRVLAERLGLRYHLGERQDPAYFLVRGAGRPKLVTSTDNSPDPPQSMWLLRTNSAPVAALARFLSSLTFCDVVDNTGIEGRYKFDVDLRTELGEGMHQNGPGLAMATAKGFGLKLEPGKVPKKKLVIDHLNNKPTPN